MPKNFRQGGQNCILRVQTNKSIERNFFDKIMYSLSTSEFERDLQAFCPKIIDLVVKTAFYVSRRTFRGIIFFPKNLQFPVLVDFEQKILGLSAENFRQGCQNYILRVPRNFLRENNFFGKNQFFKSFQDYERKNFGPMPKNFLWGCQNCILRVQRNISMKLFLETFIYSYQFRILCRNFQAFCRKVLAWLSKL